MKGMNFQPKPELKKPLTIATWVVSVLVLLLVGIMRRPEFKIESSIDFSFLAPTHATINAIVAVLLLVALYFVKQHNYDAHRKAIFGALIGSALFLASYVVYHFTTEETRYCMDGGIRKVYFFLLITHVVLAGVILPFILITFTRAYTGRYALHKKMARWVFPLWLYVAVTGPILYLMLKPCF